MVKLLKISDFMACGSFLLFMFRVCHAVESYYVFLHFLMFCPGSSVVPDCIDY